MLEVTTTGSHTSSQVLGEVCHRTVDVFIGAFFFNGPGCGPGPAPGPAQAQLFFFDDRPGPVCWAWPGRPGPLKKNAPLVAALHRWSALTQLSTHDSSSALTGVYGTFLF